MLCYQNSDILHSSLHLSFDPLRMKPFIFFDKQKILIYYSVVGSDFFHLHP